MPTPQIYAVPGADSLSDLVKRIADRDHAAFGRLYRRLVRLIFAQICESLGGPASAVPVTRAVFVEVWRLAPLFDARRDDVLAWVTAIAARRAADRLRALNHQSSAVDTGYDGHLSHELAAVLGAEPHGGLATTPPPRLR
ncbi:sigma factor [Micromonospora sp. NPDC049679]|uniref:sigma factor n=1 Tax=Micromonospora sp. NPDC049679 TaxID=3155920 RepID=UPI0033FFBE6D